MVGKVLEPLTDHLEVVRVDHGSVDVHVLVISLVLSFATPLSLPLGYRFSASKFELLQLVPPAGKTLHSLCRTQRALAGHRVKLTLDILVNVVFQVDVVGQLVRYCELNFQLTNLLLVLFLLGQGLVQLIREHLLLSFELFHFALQLANALRQEQLGLVDGGVFALLNALLDRLHATHLASQLIPHGLVAF